MKTSILLVLLFIGSLAQADFFKKEDFQVALGAQYSSLLEKRGIITYDGYQAFPIYSVQLWNPNLMLAGSALYYTQELTSENNFIRLRLNFDSTLDQPLYLTDEKEEDRIRREATTELDVFYELRSNQGSHFRIQYSQDLVAHNGFYAELYGHLAIYDLLRGKNNKVLLQPGLFASVGAGNLEHNTYFYGDGAGDFGVNNVQYGLSITSPGFIDSFWPTLKIAHFEIVGDENKAASYVQETSGWKVELLFAFRVL